MGKGRGGCTRLGGGEGVWSLESSAEEPEVCFRELEPVEERFDIFLMKVKVFGRI